MAKLVWTLPAVEDLEAIRRTIGRDSPAYAKKLAQRIIAKAKLIAANPLMGWEVAEFPGSGERETVVWPYRILYQVIGEDVVIDAVIHGARDLPQRLDPDDWTKRTIEE